MRYLLHRCTLAGRWRLGGCLIGKQFRFQNFGLLVECLDDVFGPESLFLVDLCEIARHDNWALRPIRVKEHLDLKA